MVVAPVTFPLFDVAYGPAFPNPFGPTGRSKNKERVALTLLTPLPIVRSS